MQSPDPRIYLLHIRDCCLELRECVSLRDAGGTPPSILLSAASRNLEILGEASRKIGEDFRLSHPEIPWREMNSLRNVLIHNYDGADPDMIWSVVEQEIPALLDAVTRLL
jgi:uncharacterized protein with HEPN domain